VLTHERPDLVVDGRLGLGRPGFHRFRDGNYPKRYEYGKLTPASLWVMPSVRGGRKARNRRSVLRPCRWHSGVVAGRGGCGQNWSRDAVLTPNMDSAHT
jgi:hypothetical protein